MKNAFVYYGNELYHYGVKGQKWGERKYQYEDGSYTPQGQEENRGTGRYNQSALSNYNSKKRGLTEEQKKILIAAGVGAAIALGVGAAVYIKANRNTGLINNADILIKSTELMERVSPIEEDGLNDVFYAAYGEHDMQRYEKTLPFHYMQRGSENTVVKIIKSNEDLKIAGNDTCSEIYQTLIKEGKIDTREFKWESPYAKIFGLPGSSQKSYDQFNQEAVLRNDDGYKKNYEIFFNELKSRGYSGFVDVNDQKYSGYMAKAPVIIFNNDNFSVETKKTISAEKLGEKIKVGIDAVNELKNANAEKLIQDKNYAAIATDLIKKTATASIASVTAYTEGSEMLSNINRKEK